MHIPTRFFAAIAISCTFALPGIAQDITADTVVATVNGKDITIGHMIVLRNNLPEQYKNLDDKVLFDGILDQVVEQEVLAQSMVNPSPAIEIQLVNERRALLAGAAMTELLASAVSEEQILIAYQEQYTDADPAREYNASHILVETEDEALALVVELEAGADFADLAKEHSTGPSGPNGGELGWFGAGMMVQPFEEAVVVMQDGEISSPIQTQFGWHVIILNESRFESAPALDEVRADLTEELRQAAITIVIKDLTSSAEVSRPDLSEVDPAILRDLDLVKE